MARSGVFIESDERLLVVAARWALREAADGLVGEADDGAPLVLSMGSSNGRRGRILPGPERGAAAAIR